MWPFKPKYTQESVRYILREVLRQTIDRDVVKKLLGPDQVRELNNLDTQKDEERLEYWISLLDNIKLMGMGREEEK